MPAQVDYYNKFGELYGEAILSCAEPHLWTTDYGAKGRVYKEVKERVEKQEALIDEYFQKGLPVLDVGCGFGRQAYLLAKKGFWVTGTDTSQTFIEIAKRLFQKNALTGAFLCIDILASPPAQTFPQILLLDVLEHIRPGQRKQFMQTLSRLTSANGKMILSLPHVKKRLTSQLNNRVRKRITQHLGYFRNREEHPYPVPQEKEVAALTGPFYKTVAFERTRETDYYVLQKA